MMEKRNQHKMLALAISIASQAFEKVLDRGGQPYILHCIRVMMGVGSDPELRQIAILHDLIEDFPEIWSIQKLRDLGFSERVLKALELLNHDKENVPYMEYIEAIALSEDARQVKMSDLRDNTQLWRLKGVTKKDNDRTIKYNRAYNYLSEV